MSGDAAVRAASIDSSTVRKVAGLANLVLTDEEVSYYQRHLSRILDYVGELASIPPQDESEFDPDTLAFALKPQERLDQTQPSLDPEVALVNAAKTSGTTFQVPRIID